MRGTNWRARTILLRLTYIHKSWWVMIHASHRCSPIYVVLPRYPSQHPIGIDSPSHTICYMDRDGYLKSMAQLSNIYNTSPINNHILFFSGHDSHFEYCSLTQMQINNIQPFVLKAGEYVNNQPNDNGPNSKLKDICNISKYNWMLKYNTTIFQPRHMNYVLVETWEDFMLSTVNIIRYSFAKIRLLPLRPPNIIINT